MDPWPIIDPRFVEPGARMVAEAVMQMATSNWASLVDLDVTSPEVWDVLTRHRIATLVPTAAVPVDGHAAFRERLHAIYATQMRLQAEAIEVFDALSEAGVEHRVLKGLASAFLDYPGPEMRQTGDVDLAIRPEALGAAEKVMVGLGATMMAGSRGGPLIKGTTWRTVRGFEIDIHTRLFTRTWNDVSALDLPGEPVPEVGSAGLPRPLRLVHAAAHVLGSPVGARRMSGAVDVARLLRDEVDRAEVRHLAALHGVEALVGTSIGVVQETMHVARWPELEEWEQLDWFDRRVLLADRRRWGLEYVNRMRLVAPERRLAYLPVWLVPRREAARKAWVDMRHRATARKERR